MAVARARLRKFLLISVPVAFVSAALLLGVVEAWVRLTWDAKKGTPGFYLSDPVLGRTLAPNYSGWFAGVPVQINSLGLRDPREYSLSKKPKTFRILVLGDSVTFGHGEVYEHTYPFLAQQMLKTWRPDVDWQVWNAAVPGFNTSTELADLLKRGPVLQPDLVVVGFYINDIADNFPVDAEAIRPTGWRMARSRALSFLQHHWYSTELYKRVYLTLVWKWTASESYRLRFEHLTTEDQLLAVPGSVVDPPEQRVITFDRLTDDQVKAVECYYGEKPNPENIPAMQRAPGWPSFLNAVGQFQQLHTSGAYHIAFLLNMVPPACKEEDVFYDGGSAAENQFFVDLFSKGVPTASTYDAFRHVRPSQMPQANAHALGNSNLVKAEVLFQLVRDQAKDRIAPAAPSGRPQ